VEKLHANQKRDLDEAVKAILADNEIGPSKTGDLAGIRAYKFAMNKQKTLLAYSISENALILTLLALGSHENFYRDLK
jgi:mRNA-degrading endonuclease YafQ of YafQ-DinJ toxin-antitoxin module